MFIAHIRNMCMLPIVEDLRREKGLKCTICKAAMEIAYKM